VGLDGVDFDVIADVALDDVLIVWNRLVPAVEALATAAKVSERDGTGLVQDRIWSDGLHRIRPDSAEEVLEVIAEACSKLASHDLGEFEARINALASSNLMACQRLAAMILVKAPEQVADLAYQWLSQNPCRLRFGSPGYGDSWRLSRGILARFGEACSAAVFRRVEQTLLRYRDPEEWEHARWAVEGRTMLGEAHTYCCRRCPPRAYRPPRRANYGS
jgi:hypothetical protein